MSSESDLLLESRTSYVHRRRPKNPVPDDSAHHDAYQCSLDFERVVNEYSIQAARERELLSLQNKNDTFQSVDTKYGATMGDSEEKRRWRRRAKPSPLGYSGKTATRWFLTSMIGILTGLVSIVIVSATDFITRRRSGLLDHLWRREDVSIFIFVLYLLINLLLALISAMLCIYVCPEAAGSGIPDVKAYLNGVRIKRFSSLTLFLVKVIGTIFAVSSGLMVGPEGPLVHIGAIVGASSTKMSNIILSLLPQRQARALWQFVATDLSYFSLDAERRDLVSIGAASGFAAAFGAPIGGLLFSVEEASSYFEHKMFLKTLTATALATFCLAIHHGDLSNFSIISLSNYAASEGNIVLNRLELLPFYLLIGVLGGCLGGAFCRFWKFLQLWRLSVFPIAERRHKWKLIEVAIVSMITSTLLYWLPYTQHSCRAIGTDDDFVEVHQERDPWIFHAHQFTCTVGQINELAQIFFGSREEAISSILSDPSQYHPSSLWTVGITGFFLMSLTLGVSIPSGIFMPVVLIGCSLGGAAGMALKEWFSQAINPSTFALLGAAALLSGIQRSTVSLCVILVEGTGQVKILIPVIIVVVIARYVGDLIVKEGLYEIAIEIADYPYMTLGEKKIYDVFEVSDVMSAPVQTVGPWERTSTIVDLLRESDHHGFPVVDPRTEKYLGFVRRDQLVALIECGIFEDTAIGAMSSHDENFSASTSPVMSLHKSPLIHHLAYHIKDDRFDHLREEDTEADYEVVIRNMMEEDYFDTNAWLHQVQQSRARSESSLSRLDRKGPPRVISDASLPPLAGLTAEPSSYAVVKVKEKGNVYVSHLNQAYRRKWLNIGAVMNKGTYCVNEFCPISKARHMFTALGLHTLVVVGGETGGQVVGILTRVNLLKESIEERTGLADVS